MRNAALRYTVIVTGRATVCALVGFLGTLEVCYCLRILRRIRSKTVATDARIIESALELNLAASIEQAV